jgi:hypothetical protein
MIPLLAAASGGSALGSLVGGYLGSESAKAEGRAAQRAAELQKQAADAAIAEQRRQFDTTTANLAPYLGIGTRGIGTYEQELRGGAYDAPAFDFQARERGQYNLGADPIFQNVLDQAMKRIQTTAAARGSLGGGGTQRALQREAVNFGQQFENQDYNRFQADEATRYGRAVDAYGRDYGAKQDRANRFLGLGQMGQGAATQQGQFGQQMAGQVGQLGVQGATALGQGLMGNAAARTRGNEAMMQGIADAGNSGTRALGYGLGRF